MLRYAAHAGLILLNRVVSIVDRQENGEADEFMESAELELHSIFTLKDFN